MSHKLNLSNNEEIISLGTYAATRFHFLLFRR